MSRILKIISPVDGGVYAERPAATPQQVDAAIAAAVKAQASWRRTPLSERLAIATRFVDAFIAKGPEIALELSWQMGRPSSQTPGEVRGFEERGRAMIALAPEGLEDIRPTGKEGFDRFIRHEPLGVVFVVGAWNYPYLITVNSVVPALIAGNAVILKQAAQTLLVRRAFPAALRRGRIARGRLPGAAPGRRRRRAGDPRSARELRQFHRLGFGGGAACNRRRPTVSSASASSSAARTPPMSAPTPT